MSCDCQGSSSNITVFSTQLVFDPNCNNCTAQCCGGSVFDSKCVVYAGPTLTCSTIATYDSVELALQKIDDKLCSVSGDYSSYNTHCLTGALTTESGFVDAITSYICNLNSSFNTFSTVTFVNYQSTVNTRFNNIETPGISCASASVTSTDTLQQVLNKYCNKFGSIDSNLDLSGVNWSQCFSVTAPTTIHDAFDVLIDQICSINTTLSGSPVLPVFNNTGSCLPSPGASDTLVDTVNKIKTRLCQSPTLDNTALSSSCISIPGTITDLQTLLQSILTKLDSSIKAIPTYSSDFTVTNVDDLNLCLGKHIALATPINQDRFVASNSSDTSPGTLVDKLTAGTGITIDDTTTPGQIILSSASGDDHKVLADAADDTAGYLDQKVNGGTGANGISLSTTYNVSTKKVDFIPALDMETFFNSFITYLNSNPDQKTVFCNLLATCPSPCAQPQNVSAVFVAGGLTTTTTTTTTGAP